MSTNLHREACRLAFSLASPERLDPRITLASTLQHMDPESVAEVILQSIPYSGFPAAVEALGWLRQQAPESTPDLRQKHSRDVFREVYGNAADKVGDQLASRHPDLQKWIQEFAYGTVMASGSLSTVEMELLAVSSLLAQSRMTPFHSHLRGAIRCGAQEAQLYQLLTDLEDVAHPDSLQTARDLLQKELNPS